MLIRQEFPEIHVSYHPQRIKERKRVCSSQCAFEVLIDIWDEDTLFLYEEFKVLFLDRKNGIIGCSGIILSHNHPSGNVRPSSRDNELTRKIESAAKLLDIELLDHLIITDSSYYSYTDEGNIG